MKGLPVNIYRTNYDCTNGGVTSTYDRALLVGKDVAEVFEESGEPVLKLVKRIICGREYIHAEPVDNPNGHHRMFGGNFIYTSDGRFPNRYPIPVHDRVEN